MTVGDNKKTVLSQVKTPEGCVLKRKELLEYTTQQNVYDVELYENADGTFYAIGIPREGHRLVVYGSNVVESPEMALQILVDKIRREGVEILFADEPSPPEDTE